MSNVAGLLMPVDSPQRGTTRTFLLNVNGEHWIHFAVSHSCPRLVVLDLEIRRNHGHLLLCLLWHVGERDVRRMQRAVGERQHH